MYGVVTDEVVDHGDVGTQQPDEAGLEGSELQRRHDVAQLGEVDEEEVDDERRFPDGKAELSPDEGHAVPEGGEGGLQLVPSAPAPDASR